MSYAKVEIMVDNEIDGDRGFTLKSSLSPFPEVPISGVSILNNS